MHTRRRFLTLLAALLGWMFDGMEMGLFPLVARDALAELLGQPKQSDDVQRWYGLVMAAFLIGAATGGVLFGWLGDKLGRIRAMMLSVLLYSLASGLSGLAQDPRQFAALRFLGALGMGGEWALGVALVMEAWAGTDRAWLAGLIGAFGNFGYTLCGLIALSLNHYGAMIFDALQNAGLNESHVIFLTENGHWRLLMMIGALPALLTLLIRLFVPESEMWQAESKRVNAWGTIDLFAVLFGAACAGGIVILWADKGFSLVIKTTALLVGLALVAIGYLYPAYRYCGRAGFNTERQWFILRRMMLAAGLSGVALLGTWCAVMWMYLWVGKIPGGSAPDARAMTQIWSSLGAAIGCLIGALACELAGRRLIYALLCIGSAACIVSFYSMSPSYGYEFLAMAGLMSTITAAFYGWLPLYLPELFPTAVRATGQGFGFNFGRILAAAGNLQMPLLLAYFDNDFAKACAVVPVVYIVGLVLIYFSPETRGKPLPD